MQVRENIYGILRFIVKKHRERNLIKTDIKICNKQKHWCNLTKEEKNKIVKRDLYAMKIFKNVYGFSKDFVSDAKYQTIILPKLNKPNYDSMGLKIRSPYYSDKNYFDLFLKDLIKMPEIIVRNIEGVYYNAKFTVIDEAEAIRLMELYDELVFKMSVGGGHGLGVQLISKDNYRDEIKKMKANYIVQQKVIQHSSLAYYNDSSVNIIRITSVNIEGNVEILGGILRVGAPGSFCDHCVYEKNNPLIIGIESDGKLMKKALDVETYISYDNVFGKEIGDSVLNYGKMKECVILAHQRYPKYGIIGWDLTLDESGEVVCIEYNSNVPGIVQTQLVNGPIFKEISGYYEN